jgi:cold shock CspA family protein
MAHGYGRVVRWDASEGRGAVVIEGAAAEILVDAAAVDAPGGRGLEVGELVEVEYRHTAPGDPALRAVRACPTDVGSDQG